MSYQPMVYPGSIYGIGVGSVAAAIISPATIGSLATQGILGSVAITSSATLTTQPLIGSVYGIGIGSIYVQVGAPATIGSLATQGVIGSTQITNSLLSTSGPVQNYGMGSGTTAWNPIMVESGAAGAPQRMYTVPVVWPGVGSVLVTGSVNIGGTPSFQPLIGSVYGIGVGSVAVAIIGTPAFTGSVAITNTPLIQGNAGHDAADTGSPVGVGFNARTTNPTAVSDADRVRGIADDLGRQVVLMHHVRDLIVLPGSPAQLTASGTAVRLLGSGATGVFHDAIALYMTNTGSVNTTVFITDATGSATNHIFTLAAGGGAILHPLSAWPQRWSNSHWDATLNQATNAAVYIELQAVKNV